MQCFWVWARSATWSFRWGLGQRDGDPHTLIQPLLLHCPQREGRNADGVYAAGIGGLLSVSTRSMV